MNYFSFQEIMIGMLTFALGGAFVAIIVECIRLCLREKALPFAFLRHLYLQRSRIIKREQFRMEKKDIKSSFEKGIVDFFSTVLLFFAYILTSFVCFDGVFRLINVFPLLLIYYIISEILTSFFYRFSANVIELAFRVLSYILSIPIFLIFCVLRVLKTPILCIIINIKHVAQSFFSILAMRQWRCSLKDECRQILKHYK